MFTGLVEDRGTVVAIDTTADGARLRVRTRLAADVAEGDSVAVYGVCLTATAIEDGSFAADAMHETLRRSSLGALAVGSPVNLELALRADERLGGHIMQGHVDGTGHGRGGARGRLRPRHHGRRRRRSCCATSSRRARSRSTACR